MSAHILYLLSYFSYTWLLNLILAFLRGKLKYNIVVVFLFRLNSYPHTQLSNRIQIFQLINSGFNDPFFIKIMFKRMFSLLKEQNVVLLNGLITTKGGKWNISTIHVAL